MERFLVPFQQWRCSHRKHHKNTSPNIDDDEIFKPIKKNNRLFTFVSNNITDFPFILYYIYYLVIRKYYNHFDPNYKLTENRSEKIFSALSTIFIFVFLFFLLKLGSKIGYKNILIYYFIPWVIFNYLIVMVTFLHHQNENINWKTTKGGWSSDYGALQSVNESYGSVFDYLTRNIGPYHQVHHLYLKINIII